VKAGMIKVRTLRPFPVQDYVDALQGVKVVGVLDRADSFGAQGGPIFLEVRSALYDCATRPEIFSFIYGLGGRDIFPANIEEAFTVLQRAAAGEEIPMRRHYLNLRKDEER
jgi:pyruvate ferredoxin oxidoreductase alpha subunit